MKTYPIIIVMLFASVLCNAQLIQNNGITTDKEDFAKPKFSNQKSLPIWEVTFEEETPIWTFGSISGTKTWAVGDTTPTNGYSYQGQPTPPLWSYMGQRYVKDYSESGGNFAWIDGISDYLQLLPYSAYDSYIQFDNIDLSSSQHPKICFYQNYRKYTNDKCYIDFSIDGGLTWITDSLNNEIGTTLYAPTYCEIITPQEIAGASNLSLRFRWKNSGSNYQNSGVGWEIDDIKIVENPDYDLKLVDARVNFFEFYDYSSYDMVDYYHVSSHYGMIPAESFQSEEAIIVFNATVLNSGNYNTVPVVNINVYNPENTIIYNYESTIEASDLSSYELDTIDMYNQPFHPGTEPMLGTYRIEFIISDSEHVDEYLEDNTYNAYFEITDGVYSRAFNEPESSLGTCDYAAASPEGGDKLGSSFIIFNDCMVSSVDIMFDESTAVGSSFYVEALVFDNSIMDWNAVNASELFAITTEDLGQWKNVTLANPITLTLNEEYGLAAVMIAVTTIPVEMDAPIRISCDKDNKYGNFGNLIYFQSEGTWYYMGANSAGLCIKMNIEDPIYVCPNDTAICYNSSPVNLAVGSYLNCDFYGNAVSNNTFNPEQAGLGSHTITCTSEYLNCEFTIFVHDVPEISTGITNPLNGIIPAGGSGEIIVENSEINSSFYLLVEGNQITDAIQGNGAQLSLGSSFPAGTYQIVSENIYGCKVNGDIVSLLENSERSRIAVNSLYNNYTYLPDYNYLVLSLYKQIENSGTITTVLEKQIYPEHEGVAVFDSLIPANYIVTSSVFANYDLPMNENVFYENALIFENASPIILDENETILITIFHESEQIVEGSNEGSGTVGEQPEGKSLNPLEGKTVVLVNADTEEIIDIALTDENGNYVFPAIPDNTNIQIFVTMPESPVWTAYNAETQTNQTLEVDFIVVGNSVYPSTSKITENAALIKSIEIYPNPVAEILNIKSENNISEAIIYDLCGRVLISVRGDNIMGISTQNISAGSYLLICTDKNGAPFINKFVKE